MWPDLVCRSFNRDTVQAALQFSISFYGRIRSYFHLEAVIRWSVYGS
jgi:hypothetical protein